MGDVTDFSKNRQMHLTNYSVNKKSDQEVKWKLSDLWFELEQYCDVDQLKCRIDEIIIKTVIAAEVNLKQAVDAQVPHKQ